MYRKNPLSPFAFFVGLLSFGGTASAAAPLKPYPICSEVPSASDVEAAQGAYQSGHVFFEEADYDRALLYWEDAFRRDCTAVKLLLSLARAYELAGNNAKAALSLETYLERQDDPENRESIKKRITRLKAQTETEKREGVAPPKDDSGEEPVDKTISETPSDPAPHFTKQPVWPIFVTGGGVALAVVGHGLIQSAKQKAEDLDCDGANCPTDEATKTVRSTQNAGLSLAIAGHAIGAAGGVLWYYMWTREHEGTPQASLSLEPMLGPRFQGLRLHASF
jgi:tetratricopeptide (TPR) repeat protein